MISLSNDGTQALMCDEFDAYHEMLGIPPQEQPPHHYRLLGVTPFESNSEVISNAASRQMRFVRDAGGGAYSEESQRLLNEIATAKVCLLNPEKRLLYDEQLRATLTVDAHTARPTVAKVERRVTFDPQKMNNGSWLIGKSTGCDIVLDQPTVSRIHCRLDATDEGLFVSDRRSRNGTYINGVPSDGRQRIDLDSVVTLGKKLAVPWPHELLDSATPRRIIRVGRHEDNGMVLPDQTVSTDHALVYVYEEFAVIQDLMSANGTYLADGSRIQCCRVQPEDTVMFGRRAVLAREFWQR